LCQQARKDSIQLYKDLGEQGKTGASRNVYDGVMKQQQALAQKTAAKIAEALTPEQTDTLKKIKALVSAKAAEDKKLFDELNARREKTMQAYDDQLSQLLTPAQKQALEQACKEFARPSVVGAVTSGPGAASR